ncbi:transcriptional regulator, TetR family, partial [Streptomyces ipomoeae 91-03]
PHSVSDRDSGRAAEPFRSSDTSGPPPRW